MTDERRVEVAAEAPKWVDLYGADPNFTLGMDASRYLTHQRGECPDDVPCALCLLERATAALDAHDGDLRERLAGAVEALREPFRTIDGYSGARNRAFTEAARIIRERP